MRTCIIIGSGIGGIAAAALLGSKGYRVIVLEKNEQPGGRASMFEADGLRFDMGPSWYLMPEVFDKFFNELGAKTSDYLDLVRLSPSYRVYFDGRSEPVDIYSDVERDAATFELLEPGSSKVLKRYLDRSEQQYKLILKYFLYARFDRIRSLFTAGTLRALRIVPLIGSMQRYVSSYFKSDEIQKLLQYTLVFLGSSPYNAPALYNIMSHLDFNQGVYYPKKGMYEVIRASVALAEKQGAEFRYNTTVAKILTQNGKAHAVELADGTKIEADIVISNADMAFTETELLGAKQRTYTPAYWQKRVMAPSALLLYLGVKGELPTLQHHTLYFSKNWRHNFAQIFETPSWPDNPSFYVSNTNKTDPTVTKSGVENLVILVPLGAGVSDTPTEREAYVAKILSLMADRMQIPDLTERIVYKRVFGPNDFADRYNSYKGSALGLAHTLRQTAFGRPVSKSSRVTNLYYVGSGVHPGIGLPVCIVSAHIVSDRIQEEFPC